MDHVLLRIHIAVVGFEIDRISLAAKRQKADRVYLISKEENDEGLPYLIKNEKILKEAGIEVVKEFIPDIQNLTDILSKIKWIIRKEKDNLIYINISCGSNLSAIAGTISSMMFEKGYRITPYYVKPEKYIKCDEPMEFPQPQTKGVKDIIEVVTFPAKLPNSQLIGVLNLISSKKNRLGKKELRTYINDHPDLFPNKYIEKGKQKQDDSSTKTKDPDRSKDYAWMNQNIVNKLKEWGLIEVKSEGKYSYLQLTKKGEDMLKYLD